MGRAGSTGSQIRGWTVWSTKMEMSLLLQERQDETAEA